MIGGLWIGYAESYRHTIQKRRFCSRSALFCKIICDKEQEFVFSHLHFFRLQKRLVGAPIRIGACALEKPSFSLDRPKLNLHAPCRTTVGSVQDMGAQFGDCHSATISFNRK